LLPGAAGAAAAVELDPDDGVAALALNADAAMPPTIAPAAISPAVCRQPKERRPRPD
jgi:hypothetical protein